MPYFVIDSFNRGKGLYTDKPVKGFFKSGRGLNIRKTTDTLSCQVAILPDLDDGGNSLYADIEYSLDKFITCGTDIYVFGGNGIYKKNTSTGNWDLVYEFSSVYIVALEYFKQSDGKWYLFIETSDGKIHEKELPGASDWSDVDAVATYPKTGLTVTWNDSYPFMKVCLGNLYFTNGEYLGLLGYDGSFNPYALHLINQPIRTFTERGKYLVIGTRNITGKQGKLYFWDTIANEFGDNVADFSIDIPTNDIRNLINLDNLYFTDSKNLFVANELEAKKVLPVVNPPTATTNGDYFSNIYGNTVLSYNNLLYIPVTNVGGGNSVGIYTYGKAYDGQPNSFNLDYPVTGRYVKDIKPVGDVMYVIYVDNNGDQHIGKISTGLKSSSEYITFDLIPSEKQPGEQSTWLAVKLELSSLPGNDETGYPQVNVYYQLNGTGSYIQAKLLDSTTVLTGGTTEAFLFINEISNYINIKIDLIPVGILSPEVKRIIVYYE